MPKSYNIHQFIPFSNGTETMDWMDRNCHKCKRQRCYTKRVMMLDFISGDIPMKRAEWIGIENNELNDICNYFNKPNPEKSNKDSDKFQYKCF